LDFRGNPDTESYSSVLNNAQDAARKVGLSLVPIEARNSREIEDSCRQITATDDFKARMKALAATPIGSTADELTARMRDEVRRWSAVVKEANIKFEQ
jgi:hypothetical protein